MAGSVVGEANARATITELLPWHIKEITADLTEELRHLVLWPDKPLDYVRLDDDKYGHHFGAFVPCRDKPVAVISIFFESNIIPGSPVGASNAGDLTASGDHGTSARFRKFACHPEFQGQGIGTSLLGYVASYCVSRCATVLWCDARLSSSHWYEKRGLVAFGDTFFKGTVEYTRMKMELVEDGAEGRLRSQPGVVHRAFPTLNKHSETESFMSFCCM